MTTDEGSFLRRWSRRKEEARHPEESAPAEHPAEPAAEEAAEAPFDPASLPPLENLGPDSDYTAFLRRGVPKALRSAALRRAWASQPAIAGHRPLVEYDWNWNAPGYGRLWPTDNAGPLIDSLFRHLKEEAAPAAAPEPRAPGAEAGPPASEAPAADTGPEAGPPPTDAPPAPEGPEAADPEPGTLVAEEAGPGRATPRRRHGGAMPA